jgi:hypothetical protein
MHPVITQAIAAERTRELQATGIAVGRAHRLRRSRQAQRPRLLTGIAGRVPLPRPLRGPRAA